MPAPPERPHTERPHGTPVAAPCPQSHASTGHGATVPTARHAPASRRALPCPVQHRPRAPTVHRPHCPTLCHTRHGTPARPTAASRHRSGTRHATGHPGSPMPGERGPVRPHHTGHATRLSRTARPTGRPRQHPTRPRPVTYRPQLLPDPTHVKPLRSVRLPASNLPASNRTHWHSHPNTDKVC